VINSNNTATAIKFADTISDCLGLLPTEERCGKRSHVITWEISRGDTVLFARSANGWHGTALQIQAELDGRWLAAVIAASGSGVLSFPARADLQELLRTCSKPEVIRVAVRDLDRISRNPVVLSETLAQLSELGVSVEAAGQPLTAHASSFSASVAPSSPR
jgi:hypothetical protein